MERLHGVRVARRILRSQLFDYDYYCTRYPDVPNDQRGALNHYLKHGAGEGRNPNALFDSAWYFETYPDVDARGVNPLYHYVSVGAAENRDPSPQFSTAYYANQYRSLVGNENPLSHFLRTGQATGLDPRRPGFSRAAHLRESPPTTPPSDEEWNSVRPPTGHTKPSVYVVVPVYQGEAETMRCLFSVLTAETSVPFKLLVIDDASPVATLSETLEALSARGLFELLVNSHNLGFVASVNQVLGLLDDVDVLLLNSDAEVFPGWLDRLYATLRRIPLAASVTPLTNNGTIASYPLWPAGSNIELELGPAELDNIAATSLAGQALEIPTCVGSCALLRRAAIKDVGVFDEGAFGRGYGEENDWSRKATEKGWVNLLALDTFVSHRGGVSFGPEASQRRRAGLRALETLHPGYEQSVREFIEADPLAKIRRTLDLARLQRARDGRPTVMLVSHRHGGGTNRHVQDLARRLDEAGMFAVLTEPNKGRLRLTSPLVPVTPNLAFGWNIAVPDSDLVEALRALDVRLIHVNHLQGYGARAPAGIRSLAQALAIPFDVTLHDWMAVCPRIDMIDGSGRYCGGPGASKCQTCIDRNGSQFGRVDMTSWRESYFGLLRAARRVIVPSRDSHDRWAALLPDVTFHMQPHPEEARQFTPDMRVRSDGPAHVALIGAINVGKGSQVLLKLVRDADARALPIRFHVIGHTDCDGMLSKYSRIDITGPYTSIELSSLVEESGSDVALFLSLTPETFSYTLSEALNMGLHPVAFDFGAIAGRMREEQVGTLVPMCMVDDPNDINDLLVSIIPEVPKPQTTTRYENFLKDYYDLPPL